MKKGAKRIVLLMLTLVIGCTQNDELRELESRDSKKITLFTTKGDRTGAVEYPEGTYNYGGLNFEGWNVVIGDANYTMPNEAPITINDIETEHQDSISILSANVDNRYIMTHNITYKKVVSNDLLEMKHRATYKFKIPYVISTQNTENNGQTVEGGLFVWDGADTQLDYGLAFQWILNPWVSEFGDTRYWDGANWQHLGVLSVDTNYHTLVFDLDFENEEAFITLDGVKYSQNVYSTTPKVGWGTSIDARFQAEVISIFPSAEAPTIPLQQIYFKDWEWEGEYYD